MFAPGLSPYLNISDRYLVSTSALTFESLSTMSHPAPTHLMVIHTQTSKQKNEV